MGAMTRVLNDDFRRSVELTTNILTVFCKCVRACPPPGQGCVCSRVAVACVAVCLCRHSMSTFRELHNALMEYRIGDLTMKVLELENSRYISRKLVRGTRGDDVLRRLAPSLTHAGTLALTLSVSHTHATQEMERLEQLADAQKRGDTELEATLRAEWQAYVGKPPPRGTAHHPRLTRANGIALGVWALCRQEDEYKANLKKAKKKLSKLKEIHVMPAPKVRCSGAAARLAPGQPAAHASRLTACTRAMAGSRGPGGCVAPHGAGDAQARQAAGAGLPTVDEPGGGRAR